MSHKLTAIIEDKQAFNTLSPLVTKAINLINAQNQYKEDMSELENEAKDILGLPKAEFKKIVLFTMATDNKLSEQISSLTAMSQIVDKLDK